MPRSIRDRISVALAFVLLAAAPPATAAEPSRLDQALLEAARLGDGSRIRVLLRQGAQTDARDESGLTPLMHAAAHPEAVRLLLGAGADVNAGTRSGWTALMQAASVGGAETARLLLQAGAAMDARDRLWGTALDVANRWRQPAVARLLRARGVRGSGRSVGDRVCVRPWKGEGFCGVIDAVDDNRLQIRLERLEGCSDGCAAGTECSGGKRIGGPDGVAPGESLWTKSWCLTDTGLR